MRAQGILKMQNGACWPRFSWCGHSLCAYQIARSYQSVLAATGGKGVDVVYQLIGETLH